MTQGENQEDGEGAAKHSTAATRKRSGFVVRLAWRMGRSSGTDTSRKQSTRRPRTEGQRQQGKGIDRKEVSEGSMRQNPCT
jgi:hypothetical protein